jgi:signal transduction histidine kinase
MMGFARSSWRRVLRAETWIFGVTAASLSVLFWFPSAMRSRTEGMLHPHGFCYVWDGPLVSAHVISDLVIGLAYVAISCTLAFLVYRVRHLLPFHWMFLAFGLFILTCGGTHFMEVWTLWRADFWASAALKIVTAVASLGTAFALPPLVPKVTALIHAAQVSERRKTELDVAQRDRRQAEEENRAKDLFLATLSHELRTPLNAIGGWARLLQQPEAPEAAIRKGLEAIERNVALQTRLVEDMLDVSSILTGRLTLNAETLNLAAIVRDTVAMVRPNALAKGLTIDCELPDAAVMVAGDRMRLQQVLINLLANAVKFTEHGGIHLELRTEGASAVVAIRDTGRGIAAEFMPHLFNPFAQADQSPTRVTGGLGLGLAIVRHIVERHGGSVTADSEGIGRGSTFLVTLPLGAG